MTPLEVLSCPGSDGQMGLFLQALEVGGNPHQPTRPTLERTFDFYA
jgi:hypothetical protein